MAGGPEGDGGDSPPGGTLTDAEKLGGESLATADLCDEDSDRSGETLGRFRLKRKLGAGGMGVVYEAEDLTLRRRVALKILPEAVAESEERRRRFLREARGASAVAHPNVAAVFEAGEHE